MLETATEMLKTATEMLEVESKMPGAEIKVPGTAIKMPGTGTKMLETEIERRREMAGTYRAGGQRTGQGVRAFFFRVKTKL